ncbi:3,4-dihydroxy-2-butanone-4-phosphate synthase [Jonesia quinghaiensis]|uniref:3,4-dihydroxy-2-butanone-4-phosphate synthase n=1 Tax=Jonesia quinghaiensis TaxID=262806 RepID=UPI0003FE513F|nr:3,4-dihydroxy-2-butanone-4-phosphate synthase [Jonesia quinghaiensis]
MTLQLHPIDLAISHMKRGGMVIVVDDADRENEADLIMAAQDATSEDIAFMVRHTSGMLCAPMTAERAEHLDLPPMVMNNQDPKQTAYTITCDATHGTTTGISAADRAVTLRVLADPATNRTDLNRPGHVLPLIAAPDGVMTRRGHTEAAVDLCLLADKHPVGVIAELVKDTGDMMRGEDLMEFSRTHDLPIISIADLVTWRAATNLLANTNAVPQQTPPITLPTPRGNYTVHAWRFTTNHGETVEHLTLSTWTPAMHTTPAVRVHSECLTGDVFGSSRCDCGDQLAGALHYINTVPGIVVYMRGHEGRGIGLFDKIRAYHLQDQGYDTVDANTALGFAPDQRTWEHAAAMLSALGAHDINLLTNNPAKRTGLELHGMTVSTTTSIEQPPTPHNETYLRTKKMRMDHQLNNV